MLNPLISHLSLYDIAGTPGVAADISHTNTRSEVPVRVVGGLLFELLGQSAGDPFVDEDDIPIDLRSWQLQNFLITSMHVKVVASVVNKLGISEVQFIGQDSNADISLTHFLNDAFVCLFDNGSWAVPRRSCHSNLGLNATIKLIRSMYRLPHVPYGFDHMYSSPVFLGMLALLAASLMAFTF